MNNEDLQIDSSEKILSLINILPEAKAYIQEAADCCSHKYLRATVNLTWQVFVYGIYKRIEVYGLQEFVQKAHKNGVLQGNIYAVHDLNKIKDSNLIELCHELGFYDSNIKKELIIYDDLRNSCSHVTGINITLEKVKVFILDIVSYLELILINIAIPLLTAEDYFQKLKFLPEKLILEKLKDMNLQEQKQLIRQCLFYLANRETLSDFDNNASMKIMTLCMNNNIAIERAQKIKSLIKDCANSDCLPTFVKNLVKDFLKNPTFNELLGNDEALRNDLIKLFSASYTFDIAGQRSELIRQLIDHYKTDEKTKIIDAIINNRDLYGSHSARSDIRLIVERFVNEIPAQKIEKIKQLLESS